MFVDSLAVGADAHRVAMLHAGVVDLVLKGVEPHPALLLS